MAESRTTRFELWRTAAGHTFFPADNEAARRLLEPSATLVWSVDARSWEEARRRMNQYLGWAVNHAAK